VKNVGHIVYRNLTGGRQKRLVSALSTSYAA